MAFSNTEVHVCQTRGFISRYTLSRGKNIVSEVRVYESVLFRNILYH